MKKISLGILGIVLVAMTCSFKSRAEETLSNGTWRATLKTESGIEIPFNFIVSSSGTEKIIDIVNADERYRVTDITLTGDSVLIKMPLFDAEIKAKFQNGSLAGKWVKHLADRDAIMEISAKSNVSWRIVENAEPSKYNVSGRWASTFISSDGADTTLKVGEFKQIGSKVTGTFLTTTGDNRFLEGSVSGDKLFLSVFDGSTAMLFTGILSNEGTISEGKLYSGLTSVTNWSAKKDANAKLPDAYSLTALKYGYSKIDFTFPDLDGKKVSLSDDAYKGKVVIVQFTGSWCPNCMDETAYMSPFYKKYKSRGVEVVGLAYERTTDFIRSKNSILQLKNRFDVDYKILITGYTADQGQVVASIPALNNFLAFPTTLIIDKKGDVRKIHTGFSGPGTGNYYAEFTAEFEKLINDLLAEK